MQILMIINDPPYGTGWIYNSLRLAANLLTNHKESKLAVFLLGDSASGAKSGQQTPNGYDNIERMLVDVMRKGTRVRIGGTYMDARGLTEGDLIAKHCGA